MFPAINLTSWGYQDCRCVKGDGSFGGTLTKLLFRTLPNHYPVGSAYAHFPFFVPDIFKERLHKLRGTPSDNSMSKRSVPPQKFVIESYGNKVLVDTETFGYQDCQHVKGDVSFRGMLTKLLRTLSTQYLLGSILPYPSLALDTFNNGRLRKLGDISFENYMWTKPVSPQRVVVVSSYEDSS